jgi:hypothetical protein
MSPLPGILAHQIIHAVRGQLTALFAESDQNNCCVSPMGFGAKFVTAHIVLGAAIWRLKPMRSLERIAESSFGRLLTPYDLLPNLS